MAQLKPIPRALRLGDPLLKDQVGWWMANEGAGTKLNNLMGPLFQGALQSGVAWGKGAYGAALTMAGGANDYVDLGTDALLSNTDPFTLAWLERPETATGFLGVACFMPTGASQRFLVIRNDSSASYQYLTVGNGNAVANSIQFTTAPTLASGAGKWRLWILVGTAGMSSTTPGNFELYVRDGTGVTRHTPTAGNNLGAAASNFNYYGWDGLDSKWTGGLDSMRLWKRRLLGFDLNRVLSDPFAGQRSQSPLVFGATNSAAGGGLHRMFAAM